MDEVDGRTVQVLDAGRVTDEAALERAQELPAGFTPSSQNFVTDFRAVKPRSGLSQYGGMSSDVATPILGGDEVLDKLGVLRVLCDQRVGRRGGLQLAVGVILEELPVLATRGAFGLAVPSGVEEIPSFFFCIFLACFSNS